VTHQFAIREVGVCKIIINFSGMGIVPLGKESI
jgi:hypothetical protein